MSLGADCVRPRRVRLSDQGRSEIAVASFFADAGLTPQRTTDRPAQRWTAKSIEILLGDFFSLNRELIGAFGAVHDSASLIAFPEAMRPAYVQGLAELATRGTSILLITLEYPQQEMDGPPFSVPEAETCDLFADVASIELLESCSDIFPGLSAISRTRSEQACREGVPAAARVANTTYGRLSPKRLLRDSSTLGTSHHKMPLPLLLEIRRHARRTCRTQAGGNSGR